MTHQDELACARLASLWTHHIDRHNIEDVVALFAEDAVLHGHGGAVIRGREAIRKGLSRRDPNRVTRHLLAPAVVKLTGRDEAEGVAEYILFDAYRDQHPGLDILPIRTPLAVGEFHQLYRRIDGIWLIAVHKGTSIFRRQEA